MLNFIGGHDMFKKIISLLLSFVMVCTLLVGCSNTKEQDNGKPNVVCTIFPEYDFIRAIAGDKVNLKMIVPPNVEYSSYKPSKKDLKAIENADLFIYVGYGFDDWCKEVIQQNDNENFNYVSIIDICDHVLTIDEYGNYVSKLLSFIDSYSVIDSNVWASISNSMVIVSNLSAWLCNLDPDNSEYYKENARNYMEELANIDLMYSELSNGSSNNEVIDVKNPFNYVFSDYGINVISIEKLQELGINTMESISKSDFEKGITYIDIIKSNYEILKSI